MSRTSRPLKRTRSTSCTISSCQLTERFSAAIPNSLERGSALPRRPIEWQRRLAEREAIEMARDHAFHVLERFAVRDLNADEKGGARLHRRDRRGKADDVLPSER